MIHLLDAISHCIGCIFFDFPHSEKNGILGSRIPELFRSKLGNFRQNQEILGKIKNFQKKLGNFRQNEEILGKVPPQYQEVSFSILGNFFLKKQDPGIKKNTFSNDGLRRSCNRELLGFLELSPSFYGVQIFQIDFPLILHFQLPHSEL